MVATTSPRARVVTKPPKTQRVKPRGPSAKAIWAVRTDLNLGVEKVPTDNSIQVIDAVVGTADATTTTHDAICSSMNEVRDSVHSFAISFPKPRGPDVVSALLRPENQQLIRYIGCLAIGGKEGKEGWRKLLSDTTCMHGLVSGIVGRALKEEIFSALCFGADRKLKDVLSKQETELVQQDGKHRCN